MDTSRSASFISFDERHSATSPSPLPFNPLKAYAESLPEFLRIMTAAALNQDMLQFEQQDWRRHFESWNGIYLRVFLLKGLAAFLELCNGPQGSMASSMSFFLKYLFNFFVYGLLAAHAAWIVVVKPYCRCGRTGYAVIGAGYLATSLTHICYFSVSANAAATLFNFAHGILSFAALVCTVFMSLACFKLFEGLPRTSNSVAHGSDATPLEELQPAASAREPPSIFVGSRQDAEEAESPEPAPASEPAVASTAGTPNFNSAADNAPSDASAAEKW